MTKPCAGEDVTLTSFGRPVALCRRLDELADIPHMTARERAEFAVLAGGSPISNAPPFVDDYSKGSRAMGMP